MNWKRFAVAAAWATPVAAVWFAELVARDLEPTEPPVGWFTTAATVVTLIGPVLAGLLRSGSGVLGASLGVWLGMAAAWWIYPAVAPSLSGSPISAYELGWTSVGIYVMPLACLVGGFLAWAFVTGVSSTRKELRNRSHHGRAPSA